MASVDPAEKRQLFERLSSVREIVFGVQDGVLTTAGVLCGLSGAVSQHSQVALAALASTAAGALSMAAGAYLGTRAETEVLRAELDLVRADAADKPYTVQEGLLDELCKEGLSREAGYRVVRLLSTAPQALSSTAEAKMFGLSGPMLGRPALDGVVMGIAFLVGALVPLLPYMLIHGSALRPRRRARRNRAHLVRGGILRGMARASQRSLAVGHALSCDRDERGCRRLSDRTRDLATRCNRRLTLFA